MTGKISISLNRKYPWNILLLQCLNIQRWFRITTKIDLRCDLGKFQTNHAQVIIDLNHAIRPLDLLSIRMRSLWSKKIEDSSWFSLALRWVTFSYIIISNYLPISQCVEGVIKHLVGRKDTTSIIVFLFFSISVFFLYFFQHFFFFPVPKFGAVPNHIEFFFFFPLRNGDDQIEWNPIHIPSIIQHDSWFGGVEFHDSISSANFPLRGLKSRRRPFWDNVLVFKEVGWRFGQ